MKEIEDIRFFPMDDDALLLSWESKISESLLLTLLKAKAVILEKKKEEITEIVNTYHSLLVKYREPLRDFEKGINALKEILPHMEDQKQIQRTLFHLPVCYDKRFALDLREMAKVKKIEEKKIIQLHTAPEYTVYFTGFLPGFPYLGGLSQKLFMDRKKKPRKKIMQGAVGIGGRQTGVYPAPSPGGWQIIGNCPVKLFDPHRDSPGMFQPGDKVKFYAVSLQKYEDMQRQIEKGDFVIKEEEWVSKS